MRIVIDTNAFVASVSSRSRFHWLIEALIDEVFDLYISSEVLLEYEEILKLRYPHEVAENFLRSLNELPNVHKIEISYKWLIITADPDDDKFVDLAVSSKADYLVTNDKHFNVLKTLPFPVIALLTLQEFGELLQIEQK